MRSGLTALLLLGIAAGAARAEPPGGAATLVPPPVPRLDPSPTPTAPGAKIYSRPSLAPPGAPDLGTVPPPAAPALTQMPPPVPREAVPERAPVTAGRLPTPDQIRATDRFTLAFAPDVETLDATAAHLLDGLALRLREEPGRRLELRGYAALAREGTENQARRLALGRALAARQHLIAAGIGRERLLVFAFAAPAAAPGVPPADRVELSLIR